MKRLLFLPCALALTAAAQANSPGAALTAQQISDQATAESSSLQTIERQPDGRVRMTAPMQAMEALIGPDGMELRSVNTGGEAAFGWRLEAVGRASSSQTISPFFRRGPRGDAREARAVADTGRVIIEGERVALLRPQVIEEFTASADGIRQDFVIPRPPLSGEGRLMLELTANGAQLENLPDNDQAVGLHMADGRELHYHALRVTDANGRELPARMFAHTDMRLRITVDDAGAQYPIRVDPTFSDADWTAIAVPGFDGGISAAVLGDGDLYVGGSFSSSPSGPANSIARWNGSAWSALGDGMNGSVSALVWDATNEHLYAGGGFNSNDGDPANHIARWDGNTWSELGGGTNSHVSALAWDTANGHLYAGGHFHYAGGNNVSNIARWDGNAWADLGGGVESGYVWALAWDAENSHLYAGGLFASTGGISANGIARWDGDDWLALGDGINGHVYALAWDAENGHLYVGGGFASAGGTSANRVARWDGGTWSELGGGTDGYVEALAWDPASGHLYAGGEFTTAGDNPANSMARWDGSAWTALGEGMNGNVSALAWDAADGYLYAGGGFVSAGGYHVAGEITRWDGDGWLALGNGMIGDVSALAWDPIKQYLYAAGILMSVSGIEAYQIAYWDGDAWSGLGDSLNGSVSSMALDTANGHLYVGGRFGSIGGSPAKNIARWDGSAWSALGGGVNYTVDALTWDPTNEHLYVAGDTLFVVRTGHIARWDGDAWLDLGAEISGTVSTLAWDAVNGHLYVGGAFTTAGGNVASNIARWDGTVWSALDDGVGGGGFSVVRALAWDAANGHMYAGGWFTSAGGTAANHIARWDGSAWSVLGDGVSGGSFPDPYVRTLAWDAASGHLFVGGNFISAGESSVNHIALWDGADWKTLGSGMNGTAKVLVWDADNKQLYAGGEFTVAAGHPARIARLETRPRQDPLLAISATPDTIVSTQQSTMSVTGGTGTGAVSYAVTAGTEFCSLSGEILTGTGAGTCAVTATKAGDADYRPSSDSVDVTVVPEGVFTDRFEEL